MAVEQLKYLGINRAISDFAPSTACEELINLRPTTEGLVPVQDFTAKMTNVPYTRLFIHYASGAKHYIAIQPGETEAAIMHVSESGTRIGNILGTMNNNLVDSASFASTGNYFLISAYKATVGYFNIAFLWKDSSYKEVEANVPPISFTDDNPFKPNPTPVSYSQDIEWEKPGDWPVIKEDLESNTNKIIESHPETCFGPIVVAIAFKTKDGHTFWTGKWFIYDPTPAINNATGTNRITKSDLSGVMLIQYQDFFASGNHPYGYLICSDELGGTKAIWGAKVSVKIKQLSSVYWNEDSSMLQSVEIYASKPECYLDFSAINEGTKAYHDGSTEYHACILPHRRYTDMELGRQLLYHQASISLKNLLDGDQIVNLSFGGNAQITNDTLEIDPGMSNRYGKIMSYNARFHYFDSIKIEKLGMPRFYWEEPTSNSYTADVFVRYDDGGTTSLLYLGTATLYHPYPIGALTQYSYYAANMVIVPSINVKEVITYCYNSVSHGYYIYRYTMLTSTAYNYSLYVDDKIKAPEVSQTANAELETEKTRHQYGVSSYVTEEPDAINVTEQYNPFVFMVEHSYLMPGKVLAISPQMATIPDIPNGTYPLDVFTDRGTYALVQGSANVLYGRVEQVSNLVSTSGAVSTESGNFFLAAGNLWLIAGRRAILISDALSLGPHKYIREDDMGYAAAGFQKLSMSTTYGGYNVSNYLSQVPFKDFVDGTTTNTQKATLSYNRFRDELFVSSPHYQYSYVLSLKYRQWFKISKQLYQDTVGGNIIITPGATTGTKTVLDMESESSSSVLVHLQSRPFTIGYQYSHIHRLVSMIRAKLLVTDNLIVALYGSDNLIEWKLLSFAERKGSTVTVGGTPTDVPLKVSQIRTASAARSWRYYTYCVGGTTPTDTDFGPVLVDYEPVVRRIG